MSLEDIIKKYHSDDDLSFEYPEDTRAIINAGLTICWHALPFHALDKPCVSSSWLSQIPSFRQETCQAHYRNDPVKYDLAFYKLLGNFIKVA
jgi:hypothetical protein